jgi:hypothetical protein
LLVEPWAVKSEKLTADREYPLPSCGCEACGIKVACGVAENYFKFH